MVNSLAVSPGHRCSEIAKLGARPTSPGDSHGNSHGEGHGGIHGDSYGDSHGDSYCDIHGNSYEQSHALGGGACLLEERVKMLELLVLMALIRRHRC